MLDLSIIIVSWNACAELKACLQSISANRGSVAMEVFVVDNASADGSADMVRAEFPEITLIANSENRGFAAANNQALERTTGRYVLLLNPDTVVINDVLEQVLIYADAHPDVGLVGCQVLQREDQIQRTCFSFPGPLNMLITHIGLHRIFPRSRFFGRPELSWWDRRSELRVDVVSGMFMLVRREALEAVGPMDEAYFVYAEEADWCFRFWKAGWPCVFAPVGQIMHVDGGSRSTRHVRVPMFVQLQKSLLIFNRKNFGVWSWLAAKLMFIASMAVRLPIWSLASLFRPHDYRHKVAGALAALRFHLTGVEPRR